MASMAIDENYVKTVAFVGTIFPERKLIGTAFYVAEPSHRYPGAEHLYVATAAHVARPFADSSFVRVRRRDGGVDDTRIEEWHFHPSADVAVANIELTQDQHDVVVVPQQMFADVSEHKPALGEEVYFIG